MNLSPSYEKRHEEGDDPETLIGSALSSGYTRFAAGLTDEIAKTFA